MPSVGEPGYLPYCGPCTSLIRMRRDEHRKAFVCPQCGFETRRVNGKDMFDQTAPLVSPMINWRELADDILRRLNSQDRSISSLHKELGVSRATMHRLASGKPVEAVTYLAVCRWLGYSPFAYFREPLP